MTLKVNIGSMKRRIMAGQMKICTYMVKIFNDIQHMCGFVVNLKIKKQFILEITGSVVKTFQTKFVTKITRNTFARICTHVTSM